MTDHSPAGTARLLVTGSRPWTDRQRLEDALLLAWHDALESGHTDITVVHGAAPGADTYADIWAKARAGHGVTVDPHAADWDTCSPDCPPPAGHRRLRGTQGSYCPTAGHRRNQLMVDLGAALCLAFPLGKATGTRDCMRRARQAGITVWEVLP
jgi:hypothetical protein